MIGAPLKRFIKIVYRLQSLYDKKILVCVFNYGFNHPSSSGFVIIYQKDWIKYNVYKDYLFDISFENEHVSFNIDYCNEKQKTYFKRALFCVKGSPEYSG